ncbi:MAG: hypothetical protein JWP74_2883, partial [Marmoricola sp.]|nr:hypothetical protein [Marmoricola sp.]
MSVRAESAERTGRSGARAAKRGTADQYSADAGLDLLRALGWLVLHDVTLPADVDIQIDHVVAGPSGVYVINMLDRPGMVSVTEASLVVGGVSRIGDIEEVAAAADAMRIVLAPVPVAPILCFPRVDDITGICTDVAVCSTENILVLLNGLPEVLNHTVYLGAARALSETLEMRSSTREIAPDPVVDQVPKHRNRLRGRKRGTPVEAVVEPVVPAVEIPEPRVAAPVVEELEGADAVVDQPLGEKAAADAPAKRRLLHRRHAAEAEPVAEEPVQAAELVLLEPVVEEPVLEEPAV